MPTEQRRVDTLTDDELWALNRNTTIDPKTRDIVLVELAVRKKRRDEAAVGVAPAQRVTVVAIDIPFGDIISLMIKWSFAAIPAVIVMSIVWFMLGAVCSGMVGPHR